MPGSHDKSRNMGSCAIPGQHICPSNPVLSHHLLSDPFQRKCQRLSQGGVSFSPAMCSTTELCSLPTRDSDAYSQVLRATCLPVHVHIVESTSAMQVKERWVLCEAWTGSKMPLKLNWATSYSKACKSAATPIFTFGGMSSSCRNQELRSNFSTRGGRGGFSEVGSEFCLGISVRWEVTVRASWNPAIPFVGCSCSDWEAGKEGPWDFTLTRCGIYAPS